MHKPTFVERNRRAWNQSRVDANQKDIVACFRKLGWYVKHVHDVKSMCDILILRRSVVVAVEIKDGRKPKSKRKLTEGEERFRDAWRAHGGNWELVECLDDVLEVDRAYR